MLWRKLLLRCGCLGLVSASLYLYFSVLTDSSSSISSQRHSEVIVQPPQQHSEVTFQPLPKFFKGKRLPFHQIYEPRKVGLINYPLKNSNEEITKDKVVFLWTPWNSQWNTINYYFLREGRESFLRYGCPTTSCIVTKNRYLDKADYVLFHLLDIDLRHMPKSHPPGQVWILYIMEAPWLAKVDWQSLNGIFNWTMSYRGDSDVVVKYGFVDNTSSLDDSHIDLSRVMDQKSKSVVWFVSDCHTDSRREDYVKELAKYTEIDIYGTCGNKTCFPAQSSACYEDILKFYKFYLSFENSICKDYVTEKFFNILNYDIVPVVFGGANYSSIAPKESYIDTSQFPNPRDLGNYLNLVGNNKTLYSSFFKWKTQYKSYLHPWMCHLCDKMHEPSSSSILKDVKDWWVTKAQCKRWELNKGFYSL